jgi:uracil-DNA glycosylase family 4
VPIRPKYSKPHTCQGCVLCEKGFGFAPPSGPAGAALKFVGEALGEHEAIAGAAFIGPAGGKLSRICEMAGLDRSQAGIHNIVACQPPGNWLVGSPWEHMAITTCRQYLDPFLNEPGTQVVVTLGATALKQVLGLHQKGIKVEDFHGTVQRDPLNRFWVVPTFHPSHLLQGKANLTGTVVWDLQQAQSVLAGSYTREDADLIIDPPAEWFAGWLSMMEEDTSAWMSVDIETPDKTGGRDEGELGAADISYDIKRVNFAGNREQGITVPYYGPYIPLIDRALKHPGWKLLWNADYDVPRLRHNQHQIGGKVVDLMWLWHLLQSDLPRGLGFAAPFCSTYGAWKHLASQRPAEYAAVDGFQTQRVGEQLIPDAWRSGMWSTFERHFQRLWDNVLVPARTIGVQIHTGRLDIFQTKLEATSKDLLAKITATAGAGKVHPKQGYAKKPTKAAPSCILGKHKGKSRNQVKTDYLTEGVELVERLVIREIRWCKTCGEKEVTPKHKCKSLGNASDNLRIIYPPRAGIITSEGFTALPDYEPPPPVTGVKVWKINAGKSLLAQKERPEAEIVTEPATVTRWFWQLPFNPDTPAQILAYIQGHGHLPGKNRKTKKATTDRKTLERLAKSTKDPLYKHLLDYKAVAKVHGTYVLGTRRRLDVNARLHPTPTFKPSTQRLSYTDPNITNVVGDKQGETLASGFRECVVAGPGNVIVELDFSGIEAVETGWFMKDPEYMRLAKLGVHAILACELANRKGLMSQRADLAWDDATLGMFLKEIKGSQIREIQETYDRAKRCVHGNNYGLTIYGMVQQFPEAFANLAEAKEVQDIYYELCPKLPMLHAALRARAYDKKYLGGVGQFSPADPIACHPYGYKHWFYAVWDFKLIDERKYFGRQQHGLPVTRINGKPYAIELGDDGKRCIAFFPQSTARGVLTEVMLRLFDREEAEPYGSYIGDQCDVYQMSVAEDGTWEYRPDLPMLHADCTPLRAPIHDSLLLELPIRKVEKIIEIAVNEMRRQILALPNDPSWGMGEYLSIGVDGKVGKDWKHVEKLALPGGDPLGVAGDLRMQSYDDIGGEDAEDVGELDTEAVA